MKYLLSLFLFFVLAQAQAQVFSIRGKVTDEAGSGLPGATLVLQYPWGDPVQQTVSADDGRFEFKNIGKGGYAIAVRALGFEALRKEVTLSNQDANLGALQLQPDAQILKEVKIEGSVPLAQLKGDTTEYNSAAFKVMKDANADELIEKLPGVTNDNGTIKAQGENVQQVLVDGKPFFGNDPTAALKSLPAEVIDKIQIFDQQSEQSQFTGVNDGNTVKTINIVTKTGMRNGQFGKVYAGYGYPDRYQAGGNINVFDGNRRISFIGMTNNINMQNFAVEDILGVMGSSGSGRFRGPGMMGMGGGRPRSGGNSGGPGGGVGDFLVNAQGGIATTHAFGVNYSDQWGKKTEVSASYFFNKSLSDAEQLTFRQFIDDAESAPVYNENTTNRTDNTNHRFNARFNIQIDSMNSLMVRPRLTLQFNQGNSATFGQTNLDNTLLSQTDNTYNSDLTGVGLSNSLLWRHKFARKGRTFSIDVSNGYNPKKGESFLRTFDNYYSDVPEADSLDQRSTLDVNSWNVAGNLEYTEPLTENAQLLFNYRASFQQEASDKQTYDFFEPLGGYTELNEPLTNIFSNDYRTQQAGTGYNYSKGRDLNFNARVNAQWADLVNEKTFPDSGSFSQRFFNLLPSAMFRYNIDKQHGMRIFYRSNTQLPSVDQLQEVVNNTNPLQLSVGNANLKQSFQNSLFLRYEASNPEKSSTFFAMAGGNLTNDYIASGTYLAGSDNPIFAKYDVTPGAQITQPVNLDNNYSVRSFISYGRPVKWIRSNINLDLGYNYTHTPGLLNDDLNYANNNTLSAGFTVASNFSEKVDFTLYLRPSWSTVRNTLRTSGNSEYLMQNSGLRFNWIIIEGFVLRTDLRNQLYSGLSDDYNQQYWIWNLGIGKKVFKNDRGEITLSVNDLLNQNRNITRNITETYIEDQQSNALQQFVMLSFSYNLRNFNTGKEGTPKKEGDEPWRMGPPPH